MSYEIFKQGPEVYVPILIVSLAITLVAYGIFPVAFAILKNKPIVRAKYAKFSWGVNFVILAIFKIINGTFNIGPYILWTGIFTSLGMKILRKKRLLEKDYPKEPKGYLGNYDDDMEKERLNNNIFQQEEPANLSTTLFMEEACDSVDIETVKEEKSQHDKLYKGVIIALIIIVISLAFVCFNLNTENKKMMEENGDAGNRVKEVNEKLIEAHRVNGEMEVVLDFYLDYAVIVCDESSGIYHLYDCPYGDFDEFYIYNIDQAEDLGYKSCEHCYDATYRYHMFD